MNKTTLSKALAAAGVLGFGMAAQAGGVAEDVQLLNGSGTVLANNVNTIDWSTAGSSMAVGIGPFATTGSTLTPSQTFTLKYQAFAIGLNDAGGQSVIDPTNPNCVSAGTCEYTIAMDATEHVDSVSGNTVTFSLVPGSGHVSIFFDTSPDADVSTGAGFVNGVEIARFTPGTGGFTTFTAIDPTTGIGTTTFQFDVTTASDFVKSDYIKGLPSTVFDMHFLATEDYPPGNSTTAAFFVPPDSSIGGIYPQETVNSTCTGPNTCDLPFKADGQSTFSTPEPTSLLLMGAGLAGIGLIPRRRSVNR